ncbi:MAG: hypothetical protein HW412_412, partial [Bacteroidetes bacterium]|nr:hypothetical protein [Bacteroidota bacterium]
MRHGVTSFVLAQEYTVHGAKD